MTYKRIANVVLQYVSLHDSFVNLNFYSKKRLEVVMKFYVTGSRINTIDTRGRGGNLGWAVPPTHRSDFSEKEIFEAFPKGETITLHKDEVAAQPFASAGACPVFEVEVDSSAIKEIGETYTAQRKDIMVNSATFTIDSKRNFKFDYNQSLSEEYVARNKDGMCVIL